MYSTVYKIDKQQDSLFSTGNYWASQVVLVVKNPLANAGNVRVTGSILGQEDPLEEVMATHSSILAWRIPWTEETGGLQFLGSQKVRCN